MRDAAFSRASIGFGLWFMDQLDHGELYVSMLMFSLSFRGLMDDEPD